MRLPIRFGLALLIIMFGCFTALAADGKPDWIVGTVASSNWAAIQATDAKGTNLPTTFPASINLRMSRSNSDAIWRLIRRGGQIRLEGAFEDGAFTVASVRPVVAPPATQPVDYLVHESYFAKNTYRPKAPRWSRVLHDARSLDETLGVAAVMNKKSDALPEGAIKDRLVAVLCHRGKAIWTYKVHEVFIDGRVLVVRYTSTQEPNATAEFACPLVVSVPRTAVMYVEFEQAGRVIDSDRVPAAATQPADGSAPGTDAKGDAGK